MTTLPELTYSWDMPAVSVGRVTLTGDLTHVNADELLDAITEQLTARTMLRELHVDCAGLGICDSRGLSVLLMLRRHTKSLGVGLHITSRSDALDRMFERTGTTEYLTSDDVESLRDRQPSG